MLLCRYQIWLWELLWNPKMKCMVCCNSRYWIMPKFWIAQLFCSFFDAILVNIGVEIFIFTFSFLNRSFYCVVAYIYWISAQIWNVWRDFYFLLFNTTSGFWICYDPIHVSQYFSFSRSAFGNFTQVCNSKRIKFLL